MSVVLVLNSDYSPLNMTSVVRGFTLVHKGKAEVVKKDVQDIQTCVGSFARPIIIRLLNYINFRHKTVKINRKRIFKRDGYTCQFVGCNSKTDLTIDHVIPKCRGGQNTWTNLITACTKCNCKKDNKTLKEARMALKRKPFAPSIFSNIFYDEAEQIWKEYVNSF